MGYIWLFFPACADCLRYASVWMVAGTQRWVWAFSPYLCWLLAGGKPSKGGGHARVGLAVSPSLRWLLFFEGQWIRLSVNAGSLARQENFTARFLVLGEPMTSSHISICTDMHIWYQFSMIISYSDQ